MTGRLPCRECGAPLTITTRRARQARLSRYGVLRDKHCRACGFSTTTLEVAVGDLPYIVAAFLERNTEN